MNCVIMPVRHARSHVCACTDGEETLWTARIPASATTVAANPQRCFDMYVLTVDIVIDADAESREGSTAQLTWTAAPRAAWHGPRSQRTNGAAQRREPR